MIDTVVLTIPVLRENILAPERFSPSADGLFKEPFYKGYTPCKLNPSKEQKDQGRYLPRLTLSSRPKKGNWEVFLRIEFSAPKILFGNNLKEVDDKDYKELISELCFKLFTMGIKFDQAQIENASVSSIHFCKNILLEPYQSCSMVINELERYGNYNEWLDLDKTSFRNGGHILHLHTDRWEFVVYDKLRDLQRAKLGERRSVDKDNYSQLDIFNNDKSKQEILRLELRINSKIKIATLLSSVGCGMALKNITFRNIFKKVISRKLLIAFLRRIKIMRSISNQNTSNSNILSICESIKKSLPLITDSEIMKLTFGFIFINEYGIKAFKRYMQWNTKKAYKWNRFYKKLEKIYTVCNNRDTLEIIESKI